jgi:glycine/D-amino acid oxidase-like deaminating enzyme
VGRRGVGALREATDLKHTAEGWWLDEAGRPQPLAPLEGARSADVVVVGGGYAGLWTAWHLLEREPQARVILLEAGMCGHGPSGRNGGFCESLWIRLPKLCEGLGDRGALEVARASSNSVRAIGEWCETERVDAWFNPAGYVLASTAPPHERAAEGVMRTAAMLGEPERVRLLDEDEIRRHCDSPRFRSGLMVPEDATVQPARLALGLRKRLLERGAGVFERSRVLRLRAGSRSIVAETAGGTVTAGVAVIAVGAAARGIPRLRTRLAVTSSHAVLTEPVPDVLESIGWTGGECITDGRVLVDYFRTTRDGRILLGWGGGRPAWGARLHGRVDLDSDIVSRARARLPWLFPQLKGRRITHAWGGPIDVSPHRIPEIGSMPGAPVHYVFGFTGNGVGPSHLAGKALASLALDRRDSASRLPLVEPESAARVPPEPLAFAGGSLVRRAMIRRDRLEEEERRLDPLTRAACAAPKVLGLHVGRS